MDTLTAAVCNAHIVVAPPNKAVDKTANAHAQNKRRNDF
jgi:hypothetical protein